MRKILFITLLFIFSVFSSYATEEDAFNNVVAFAQAVYDELLAQNIELSVSEDAYIYNVEKGKQIHIEGTFQPGNVYLFIVSGCNDASQIDMALFDSGGNLVQPGESGGKDAYLIFEVTKTGDYIVVIQLTNTTAGKSSAHVGLIIMYTGSGS